METASIIGVTACIVSISAPAFKSDRRFKTMILIAAGLWAPYYWLLGAMSGFAFTLLVAIRQVVSIFTHRLSATVKRISLLGLVTAMTIAAALTWEGWQSILPWAASVNAAHAYFARAGLKLRTRLFFGDCAWLTYAAIVHAWPHVALMLVMIIVNLTTIWRLQRDARRARPLEDSLNPS